MKRFLILLALLALVMPVAGLSLTFQDASEFTNYVGAYTAGTASVTWNQNKTGGNSNILCTAASSSYSYMRNLDPLQTTYAAATIRGTIGGSGGSYIELYDAANNLLDESVIVPSLSSVTPARLEMKMVGSRAYYYKNGALFDVSPVLAQNPSYVNFGGQTGVGGGSSIYVDDFVYGATENRYIFGSPEQGYFLKKDLINPAASGLCFANGTIVSNYNITTTWGVGDTNTSRNIIFKEWSGASNAWTYTTTAGTMAGSIAWPLQEAIFNNPDAPYGYYITTVEGSGVYSSVIPYIAGGGFVNFDSEAYGTGDTATMTWTVDAGIWDTTTYNYELRLQNALYGTVMDTWSVTSSTGSETYLWSDSDELGVYYATLWRINKATSAEEMMNGDTAELTGYVRFTGYTHDAETASALSGVNISIVQGSTVDNILSGFDGNYTSSADTPFGTGAAVYINVTKSGYEQYVTSFTPIAAKTIHLNFTLLSSTPTYTGVGLGGVVRDTVYGRPIPSPTVAIANATHAESYSVTGNSVGYYVADEDDGIFFTVSRCYSVTGSKTGYGSATYLKCLEAT